MSVIEARDYILLVRLASGGFVEVSVLDIELIWHIKVKLYKILNIPPEKQKLYLLGEVKELENLARVLDFKELKLMKGEKRLVILKEKETGSRRTRRITPLKTKKFREALSPQYSYAGGRGLAKGIVNYVNTFEIHTISKEFLPIGCRDSGRLFEVIISKKENNEQMNVNLHYHVPENENRIEVQWIPQIPGNFAITIRTTDGYAICGSPFTTVIIDPEINGPKIKKMIGDSEFNVEAARIVSEWATKEEYNNVILNEIGIDSIISLATSEPVSLLQPIVCEILGYLLEKDVFRVFISSNFKYLFDIVELNKSTNNISISRFVSKSFALIGHYAQTVISKLEAKKEPIPTEGVFSKIDASFFDMIGEFLKTNDDVETIRNLSRSIASFSTCQYYSSLIANILPSITSLFENIESDISTRRYSLITLSNLSSFMGVSKIKYNIITESTVQKLISSVDYPLTGDLLVTDSLRALANLCEYPPFGQIIAAHSYIDRIVKSISGTDTIANWEICASLQLLHQSIDVGDYTQNFVRTFSHDDLFNYESVRLLYNLFLNQYRDISKIIVKYRALRSLVLFVNSGNLSLQEVTCGLISLLAKYLECRKEIIKEGGLQALCLALNTCNTTAIAPIISTLAQFPLNVKTILVNIIGNVGVRKLVDYYRQSEDLELRKHAAILLASLVGNDGSYDIIKEGGSELVKSLIELIKNRTVNTLTQIAPAELIFQQIIGEGISGVVWEATWKDDVVAVKKFNSESISFSEDEFQSEVALMSVLRHENISHCIGSWMNEELYYIVTEFSERGSLAQIIGDHHADLSMPLIIHMAIAAAKGMCYLHRLGIIHRDLKPGNLLVSADWSVKVADFGLSRVSDKQMTRGVGTPVYTAPEVLSGCSYSLKADVYSFGYILWEMVTGRLPFEELPPFEAVHRAATENLRPEIPENCILKELISHCWDSDPDRRPTFEEITQNLMKIQLLIGPMDLFNQNEEEDEEKIAKKTNLSKTSIRNLHLKDDKKRKDKSALPRSYTLSPRLIRASYDEQELNRATKKNFGAPFNF